MKRSFQQRRAPSVMTLLAKTVLWSVFLSVFLATSSVLAEQPELATQSLNELDRRLGDGEQCIVCDQPIRGDEIVEMRYKGRSFFVAASMLGDLQEDPDVYFLKLQARSALFDERAMEGRVVSTGWLFFGVYVVIGLVFAAICGYVAIGRSLAPLPWFFAGLLGNVAALIVLLATRREDASSLPAGDSQQGGFRAVPAGLAKVPLTHTPLPCSSCGATNHPAAASCSGCGIRLAPAFKAEAARV